MSARRIAAVLGVSATVLLGSSGIASASSGVAVPGARADLYSSTNIIKVRDTACDGDSVYAKWKTEGGREIKINNDNGCHQDEFGKIPHRNGTVIFYKVCVADAFTDTCSPWRRDVV